MRGIVLAFGLTGCDLAFGVTHEGQSSVDASVVLDAPTGICSADDFDTIDPARWTITDPDAAVSITAQDGVLVFDLPAMTLAQNALRATMPIDLTGRFVTLRLLELPTSGRVQFAIGAAVIGATPSLLTFTDGKTVTVRDDFERPVALRLRHEVVPDASVLHLEISNGPGWVNVLETSAPDTFGDAVMELSGLSEVNGSRATARFDELRLVGSTCAR